MPSVDKELAKYVIYFNAYTLLGILKPWFQDGMKHPAEALAGLLIQLTGSSQRMQACSIFKAMLIFMLTGDPVLGDRQSVTFRRLK